MEETVNYIVLQGSDNIVSGVATIKPLYVIAEKQVERRTEKTQSCQLLIYDIIAQKLQKKIKLGNDVKIGVKAISDTTIYLISGMRNLYQLNPLNLELTDISATFKSTYSQFASGLSSIDFSPEKGALVVITNEGKTYTVFPDQQKILTTAELLQEKQEQAGSRIGRNPLYEHETTLYMDDEGFLINYKNPFGSDFITEYFDVKTKESKWKVNSETKVEQAKPYNNGFILTDNPKQLIIVDKAGTYKQIKLS